MQTNRDKDGSVSALSRRRRVGVNRSWLKTSALAALLLASLACTVGPDYELPVTEIPDAWATAAADELRDADSPLETWWLGFQDPDLDSLVVRARSSNLSLRSAVSRVDEARALLGIASGYYAPDLILDGSYTRNQPSNNGALGDFAPPGGFESGSLYELGLGASWEIDLFGRIRRGNEAASANLDASLEDYRDVLVVLLADVASNYVDVRTLQARLDFARGNVKLQSDTLQLTRDRFNAGLTSARDVAQAESNLANTEAAIPSLETRLEAALNRIAVLLGEMPGELHDELLPSAPIPAPREGITIGLPAELLRRRPDIRRAERQLAAQTALVGAATADLYPTFSLSGVLALDSTSGGDLVSSDSVTWAIVPGLRWNLFSAGKIRNQIRAEEARTEQALLRYEQTVLEAVEEVESTLVALEREKIRRDHLEVAVDATERTLGLVHTQYVSGLTDFQTYLDAQRALLSQQDAFAVSEGQVILNLIALNRALGGGWGLEEESISAAKPTSDQSSEVESSTGGAE